MKKALVWTAVIAGISGIAYGLYRFYKSQIDLAMSYCYKISAYKFNKLSTKDVNLDVFVKVLNNSSFEVDLTGYALNVEINGKHIAKIASNKSQTIQSNGVSELGLNVNFNPDKVFNLQDAIQITSWALTDKTKVVIRVSGTVSVKMNFIKVSELPIDIKMTLAEITAPEDPTKPKQKCAIK